MKTMILRNPPTVSEVNRYIKPIVEELAAKHQKVTHPDFDQELREITGIGWKQVKNYRNHPNQTLSIQKNSKVLSFVFKSRKQDRWYQIKKNHGLLNQSNPHFFHLLLDRREY